MQAHLVIALALAMALVASTASARQAQVLGELEKKLLTGEEIEVVDAAGNRTRGRFGGVTPSSLRLRVDGTVREIQEAQIQQVRKRRPERDGVLLGLGIGALAGLTYVQIHCRGAVEHDDCVRAGSVIIGAPMTAAGAFIDLGMKRYDPVLARTGASARRWQISPMFGRQTGIVATIAF